MSPERLYDDGVHGMFRERQGDLRMGMPQGWHRRQAMLLASQLPEDQGDAQLIMQAVRELLDTFMDHPEQVPALRPKNVLPFISG